MAANECGAPPAGTTVVSDQPEPAVTQKFGIAHEPRIQSPVRRITASEFVLRVLNSSMSISDICSPRRKILLKSTTRAKRAMIRHLHNTERLSELEIANKVNMGPTIVQFAIRDLDAGEAESDNEYMGDLTLEDEQDALPRVQELSIDLKESVELHDSDMKASDQDAAAWGDDDKSENEECDEVEMRTLLSLQRLPHC